ncbi:MAG: hypothetical protein D3925_00865 [Candidatus Electrothrix sp. AR5]|nr:hypothetical protein [Candidatus Electrothrix sp. AR5]
MDENISKVVSGRIVFAKKPVKGKSKISNRPVEPACCFRMGVKGFGQSIRMKIGYMKWGIMENITSIIKMPAIMQDAAVEK